MSQSVSYERATSRAWLEVSEDALLANYREMQSLCKPDTTMICVLKADAYGYGAQPIGRMLYRAGVRHFSAACMEEALELKSVLPDAWILNMGVTPDVWLETAIRKGIRLTAGSLENARKIYEAAERLKIRAAVHIKIDSGLHRLGFLHEQADQALQYSEWIDFEGLYSHLALRSDEQSREQYQRFCAAADVFLKKGHSFRMLHLLDSIGLVKYRDWQMNAVRIGAALYGNMPPAYEHFERRRAVGRFCARITRIETIPAGEGIGYGDMPLQLDTRVATLAVGYVDGYAKSLSHAGEVEIHGKRARVLGLVCMDQMMADVSAIPEALPNDIAVLLGDGITLNEFADRGDLNRNEATAMIGRRVPRIYMHEGAVTEIISRM